MSNPHLQSRLPVIPRLIRALSLPITLGWVFIAVALGMISPSLDDVASQHSVPMTPLDAPAFKSMMHIGDKFNEFHTDSSAMVVLEGQDKLGDSAHEFYNRIVSKLNDDHAHVQNVQDFWSDPLTAAGSQSPDGKAAYVQVFLNGAQGTTPSHESVAAVRKIVADTPAPPGVKAYVAGNTVLNADTSVVGHKSMAAMAMVSIAVIFVMLLMVYRSIVTTLLSLVVIGIELFAAQGVAATAGNLNIIGLTPYAVSMITMLSIAAGTDYVIFLLGRYHEARSMGAKPGGGLLHGLSRRLPRHLGLGADHRGCLHVLNGSPVAVFPNHGNAVRDSNVDHRFRGTDPCTSSLGGRLTVRPV